MALLKTIFFSALIITYFTTGILSHSICGDWEAYKEETCIKMFGNAGLVDYEAAEKFCTEQEGSRLLSIDTKEKQKFIETFLKSNSVVDNIWIGLKYLNNSYQWVDGTSSRYINWEKESNLSHCVQLQTETSNFGLWSSESCIKKNLVICEKTQEWSFSKLQAAVMKLIKADGDPVVPVGFIYVQLPKELSPAEIWPSTDLVWEDVSKNYEGLFFRTVGGNAAQFEEIQEEDSPRLVSMRILTTHDDAPEIYLDANDAYSQALSIDGSLQHTGWELQAKVSKVEVRPRNTAIKIWKRTA